MRKIHIQTVATLPPSGATVLSSQYKTKWITYLCSLTNVFKPLNFYFFIIFNHKGKYLNYIVDDRPKR